VNQQSVSKIFKRYRGGGMLKRKPKSGRPRIANYRQERVMIRGVKKDPTKTASDVHAYATTQLGLNLSISTTRRILKRNLLVARRPARKPLLKEAHRNARLMFGKKYQKWGP
jgi:transposase